MLTNKILLKTVTNRRAQPPSDAMSKNSTGKVNELSMMWVVSLTRKPFYDSLQAIETSHPRSRTVTPTLRETTDKANRLQIRSK